MVIRTHLFLWYAPAIESSRYHDASLVDRSADEWNTRWHSRTQFSVVPIRWSRDQVSVRPCYFCVWANSSVVNSPCAFYQAIYFTRWRSDLRLRPIRGRSASRRITYAIPMPMCRWLKRATEIVHPPPSAHRWSVYRSWKGRPMHTLPSRRSDRPTRRLEHFSFRLR